MQTPALPLLQQVHIGLGPNGYEPVASVDAAASAVRAKQHDQLIANLVRLCPEYAWPRGSYQAMCPSPILVHQHHQSHLESLHEALTVAVTDIVQRWWSDREAGFPMRMPLATEEEDLLRWLDGQASRGIAKPFSASRGSWRPDFLIRDGRSASHNLAGGRLGEDEVFCITEINARFPFNGFMHEALGQEALDEMGLAKFELASATNPAKLLDGLMDLFQPELPLHLVSDEELGMDIHMFTVVMQRRYGVKIRRITPADLRLVPDPKGKSDVKLCCVVPTEAPPSCRVKHGATAWVTEAGELVEEVHQIGLELHQRELAGLEPEILRQVSLRCFNDMRTVLLVHDKRMLGVVKQELEGLVSRGVLTPAQARVLDRGVADTVNPGSREMSEVLELTRASPELRSQYLLKPVRGGKGAGIVFGDEMSPDEWVAALQRLLVPGVSHVVQRRITPRLYDVVLTTCQKRARYPLVGTYHAVHGRLLGLGVWRTGPDRICAINTGGAWMCSVISRHHRHHRHHQQGSLALAHAHAHARLPSPPVPHLHAADLLRGPQPSHTTLVAARLRQQGILKITLASPDPESTYLQHLIADLHRHHGHKLPISHSASRGWFWDVRPATSNFQTQNHQARSETMDEFPWHTDCSYEDATPRFFALQVLRHDHFGGGTLSVTNVEALVSQLSRPTRLALARNDFNIAIPREFVKSPDKTSVTGRILATSQGRAIMRFRRDIITPLTPEAASALHELDEALSHVGTLHHATLHLRASDLPSGSVILVDNLRWLHARDDIKDPARHLRRVRWDAVPFGANP
ncbi:hypothetical protein ED733_005110 [Metarhizium rileyi]|uniref:TauD/TfdA-like domain-containing protein n=1 Tax=Metarhizium rileyi (strain RCEF 4871) TaxID=1649241 RepID=A0A5C6GJ46_METRR|nr:hypothetical protein ED733_005110 [Metarhizium rileyi]